MVRLSKDILSVINAVQFESRSSYLLNGESRTVPKGDGSEVPNVPKVQIASSDRASPVETLPPIVLLLAQDLYQRLYCRQLPGVVGYSHRRWNFLERKDPLRS